MRVFGFQGRKGRRLRAVSPGIDRTTCSRRVLCGLITAASATAVATTTAAATAAATASATTAAVFARPGFIDGQRPAVVLFQVQTFNSGLRFTITRHLDETEAF